MPAEDTDNMAKDPAAAARLAADKMDDMSEVGLQKAKEGLELAQLGLEKTKHSVGELMDAVNEMIGKVKDSLETKSSRE